MGKEQEGSRTPKMELAMGKPDNQGRQHGEFQIYLKQSGQIHVAVRSTSGAGETSQAIQN